MGYPDLFADLIPGRAKPRILMHVADAFGECSGDDKVEKQVCKMSCKKCGSVTGWLEFANVS